MICTKTTLKRAARTFVQSALAYITVNVVYINFTDDKVSVKSAVTGGCSRCVGRNFRCYES